MFLSYSARLRLAPSNHGGRKSPLVPGEQTNWQLGNTWLGCPTLDDARVLISGVSELHPGESATVRIEPIAPEFWALVGKGRLLPLMEGDRQIGLATVTSVKRDPRLSPSILAFAAQAREFCAFVDQPPPRSLSTRLQQTRLQLVALYRVGATLPLKLKGRDRRYRFRHVSSDSRLSLNDMPDLGRFGSYWEVYDPYKLEKPLSGNLADDVADIYGDIQNGFAYWDDSPPQFWHAAEYWMRFMHQHWGDHAVDAIRALQRACATLAGESLKA